MGGFVGSVISFVGRPFGIYTHDEIFTDIQISNLLTPGEADKQARRIAKYQAEGNIKIYQQGYRTFQREYVKKYSAQFMKRQGYLPNSTAVSNRLIQSNIEDYLQILYGYANVSVESYKDKFMTVNERGLHAVQQIPGYDFASGKIIIGLNNYSQHAFEELVDNTQIQITSTRLFYETIVQNLTDNYSYDGTEVTIGGELYTVGAISGTIVGGYYETICTHSLGILPDEVITTPVETIVNVLTEPAYGAKASYISYRVTSGEVGTELMYWVAIANSIEELYNIIQIDVTAIVPMKEDNVMVDIENQQLRRMLRKLNLSGEQLESSIENPDMDSAYLMTGLDPQNTDDVHNEVMFKFFNLISSGSGDISIDISKLDMNYTFELTRSVQTGVIGAVGTYARTDNTDPVDIYDEFGVLIDTVSGGEYLTMTLQYQVGANEYEELVVTGFKQEYTISGNKFTAYLDSTNGYCRLILPLSIMNSLPYKKFVPIYENSLCMLAYSIEVVEVQWYETSAFGTLLKIAAIVIFVVTVGAGSSLSAALLSIASSTAIVVAASYLAKAIGGTLGAVIGAVATIVGLYFNPYGAGMTTNELWLLTADQAIGTVNQITTMKMEEVLNNMEAYVAEMAEKFKELEKLSEEYNEINPYGFAPLVSDYAGKASEVFLTTEAYCASILEGADMNYLIDYGRQIEHNINTRNSVFTGVSN